MGTPSLAKITVGTLPAGDQPACSGLQIPQCRTVIKNIQICFHDIPEPLPLEHAADHQGTVWPDAQMVADAGLLVQAFRGISLCEAEKIIVQG